MKTHVKHGIIVLCFLFVAGFAAPASAHEPGSASAASEDAQQASNQFDFRVGKWQIDGQVPDTVKVVVPGSALLETWKVPGVASASGVMVLDSKTGMWTQTYTNSSRLYMQVTGKFENGQITLTGVADLGDGRIRPARFTFRNITRNSFDQLFEVSDDDGKTFRTVGTPHWVRR